MRSTVRILLAGAFICAAAGNSFALVGISQPGGVAARHTVMVIKASRDRPGNCTGVVIAPRVVLTAAHCVNAALNVLIHVSKQATPSPLVAARIAVHPQFVPDAIRKRVRSIDLALVLTQSDLPEQLSAIALDNGTPVRLDQNYLIAGFGVREENDENLTGELRTGKLSARSPLSSILLWSGDPQGRGLGACTGDSGGPIFNEDMTQLVAITAWATGSRGRKCGDLTQGMLVGPQRGWIEKTLRQWGVR